MSKVKISYSSTGVDYDVLDPLKRLAQKMGLQTAQNLDQFGYKEISGSRGESAYVWEEEDAYRAFVVEGLGTKNLVADEMGKDNSKTFYDIVAQDTIAAIVNDLLTVGALPQVVNAYFGSGGPEWFSDQKRMEDLVTGWTNACQTAGCSWGGGETPGLSGIINPQTLDLAGAAIGIIKPKERLTLGDKLQAGDAILLIESSGVHANGLSLARSIAQNIPQGYQSQLSNGKTYGEALLTPTHIYVKLIKDLFDAGIDIHYMVNVTGHGWRKLMRANRDFTYQITQVPPVPLIFEFIQKNSGSDDEQMYAIFNMGAGFAIYLPRDQVEKAQEIVQKNNLKSWDAGEIQEGEKQVVIEPKKIIFKGRALNLR
ncbi:phosphoribosylformylglycinamidine cyclo-ligase [Candidatus Daviesbacteria bacterium]|nr:phosphoribosylformylglycinamidine cyclo-ligase [Candidatus Daviesbacteria bacterium]